MNPRKHTFFFKYFCSRRRMCFDWWKQSWQLTNNSKNSRKKKWYVITNSKFFKQLSNQYQTQHLTPTPRVGVSQEVDSCSTSAVLANWDNESCFFFHSLRVLSFLFLNYLNHQMYQFFKNYIVKTCYFWHRFIISKQIRAFHLKVSFCSSFF